MKEMLGWTCTFNNEPIGLTHQSIVFMTPSLEESLLPIFIIRRGTTNFKVLSSNQVAATFCLKLLITDNKGFARHGNTNMEAFPDIQYQVVP